MFSKSFYNLGGLNSVARLARRLLGTEVNVKVNVLPKS